MNYEHWSAEISDLRGKVKTLTIDMSRIRPGCVVVLPHECPRYRRVERRVWRARVRRGEA